MSFSLLNELVVMARSIVDLLSNGDDDGKRNETFFRPTMEFLTRWVQLYGHAMHKVTMTRRQTTNGNRQDSPLNAAVVTMSPMELDQHVTQAFESLLLHTLSKMDDCLGQSWTMHSSKQRQRNGEPAVEILSTTARTMTQPRLLSQHHGETSMSDATISVTNGGLLWLLSLLKVCINKCPYVLLGRHKKGEDGYDQNDDSLLLFQSAMDAATDVLLLDPLGDDSMDLCLVSIEFLESTLDIITDQLSTSNMVSTLLVGCVCGKVDERVLLPACQLLWKSLPNSTMSPALLAATLDEHFWLGSNAQQIVWNGISQRMIRAVSPSDADAASTKTTISDGEHRDHKATMLLSLFKDSWQLHREVADNSSSTGGPSFHDATKTMPESDAIQEFCRRYQQFL
jgi:hypothetical protein